MIGDYPFEASGAAPSLSDYGRRWDGSISIYDLRGIIGKLSTMRKVALVGEAEVARFQKVSFFE